MIAGLLAMYLILRYWYIGKEPITVKEFTVSGITGGMGITCGENYGSVIIALPGSVKSEDVLSVSTRPDVAYLELDRDHIEGNRIMSAQIIALSPGITELYVKTTDGTMMSRKYTVNIVAGEGNIPNQETAEIITEAVLAEGEVLVTPSGERYHLSYTCAGGTSFAMPLEEAVEKSYTPCKNCAMAK